MSFWLGRGDYVRLRDHYDSAGLSADSTGLTWTKLRSMELIKYPWRSLEVFGHQWWGIGISGCLETQWGSVEINGDQFGVIGAN